MNISKNILLKLKKLIKNDNLRANSCILLSLVILATTSGFAKKNDSKASNYEFFKINSSNLYLSDKLDEILINSAQAVINSNAVKQVINNTIELIQSNTNLDNETLNEIKVEHILKKFNLTEEQFDTLVAIVLAEAKWDSYEDAYAVINTMYNRIISTSWINYVNYILGDETGTSLYYQSICPGQFIVYQNGNYLEFLGKDNTDRPGYKAIIDFLTTGEKMHDFLSFVAADCGKGEYTQFVEKGNCYSNKITEDNLVPEEDRIFDFDLNKQDVEIYKSTENNQEKVKVIK